MTSIRALWVSQSVLVVLCLVGWLRPAAKPAVAQSEPANELALKRLVAGPGYGVFDHVDTQSLRVFHPSGDGPVLEARATTAALFFKIVDAGGRRFTLQVDDGGGCYVTIWGPDEQRRRQLLLHADGQMTDQYFNGEGYLTRSLEVGGSGTMSDHWYDEDNGIGVIVPTWHR